MCTIRNYLKCQSNSWVEKFIAIIIFSLTIAFPSAAATPKESESEKLLILLIDGFRWDYYDLHKSYLPGFTKFLEKGVQVEYVEPVFPSLSLPSWTSIVTGLYPGYHNILDNHMVKRATDQSPEKIFNFMTNSSMQSFWWQSGEPLWITATKLGHKVYMADFARCDVPYQGILPTECTGFKDKDVNYHYREHLKTVVSRFKEGYILGMIYFGDIDYAQHDYGIDSKQVLNSLIEADIALSELMNELEMHNLLDKVNVVITSDHGITDIRLSHGTKYVMLENYIGNIENIYKVIGYGAFVMIATVDGQAESVFNNLTSMPGVDVYKKEDIPEALHLRESHLVHDILVVAQPGNFIVGLHSEKQVPRHDKVYKVEPCMAWHGYYNMSDMRAIFFASGPAFVKGAIHPPIRLIDQYQVFTHVLGVDACNHNGTWDNVKGLFSK